MMLTVTDLYCERDERVLFEHLCFSILEGQVLQIEGSNGSGKTTLLRILCGLNQDFLGDIAWQGKPVSESRANFYQNMFYIGHAPAINNTLTPVENLRWYCASQGLTNTNNITEALEAFNLYGYDEIPCYQMSAGQQRRVSLARMKLTKAKLWILDEPFTALDKEGVSMLEHYLAEHVLAGGAVILTTHHSLQIAHQFKIVNLDNLIEESVRANDG